MVFFSSSSSRPVFGILLPQSRRSSSLSFTCGGGAKVRGAASAPDQLPWQPGPNNQRWHVNYGYYVMKTVPRKESSVAFLRRAGRTGVSEVKRRRQHNSEQNADASDSRSTKFPLLAQNDGRTKTRAALASPAVTGKCAVSPSQTFAVREPG